MVKRLFTAVIALLLIATVSCAKHTGTVKSIIDGDTIVLSDGRKVRLIGVDTPECHMSRKLKRDSRVSGRSIAAIRRDGLIAKKFTKALVDGKHVRLEYGKDKTDRYGRTLAYLYLDDGTFVNEEIVRQGYAIAYVKYSFKYMDSFRAAEEDARKAHRGLWAGGGL